MFYFLWDSGDDVNTYRWLGEEPSRFDLCAAIQPSFAISPHNWVSDDCQSRNAFICESKREFDTLFLVCVNDLSKLSISNSCSVNL